MLRIIENGDSVQMVMTDDETYSVDTKEELRAVAERMKVDRLVPSYLAG